MTTLVLPFYSSEATLATTGGKGANLSRMARVGFAERVPPGFLITISAYQAFVQANDLQSQIVAVAFAKWRCGFQPPHQVCPQTELHPCGPSRLLGAPKCDIIVCDDVPLSSVLHYQNAFQ